MDHQRTTGADTLDTYPLDNLSASAQSAASLLDAWKADGKIVLIWIPIHRIPKKSGLDCEGNSTEARKVLYQISRKKNWPKHHLLLTTATPSDAYPEFSEIYSATDQRFVPCYLVGCLA